MQRQFFSGNTIEQAVMAAARHYKVEPERISYKQREKKHGFLNARKRIVIEVDPNAPTLSEEQIAERENATRVEAPEPPVREARDTQEVDPREEQDVEDSEDSEAREAEDDSDPEDDWSSEDDNDRDDYRNRRGEGRGGSRKGSGEGFGKKGGNRRDGRKGDSRGRRGRSFGRKESRDRRKPVEINEFEWLGIDWDETEIQDEVERDLAAYELALEQILDVMDLDIEYSLESGDVMELDFEGEDSEILLEDDGRVLKAIEHILPRMVRSLVDKSIPCNADCEGFRAKHELKLRELALGAADSAVETGRKKLLPPMNPADRRIVHLALVDRSDVETVSDGHGFMKRVRVMPVKEPEFDDEFDD